MPGRPAPGHRPLPAIKPILPEHLNADLTAGTAPNTLEHVNPLGAKLGPGASVSAGYGVSRSVIRDALRSCAAHLNAVQHAVSTILRSKK